MDISSCREFTGRLSRSMIHAMETLKAHNNSSPLEPEAEDEVVHWWEICIFLATSVFIVAVNAFVIFLVMREKSLKTATNLILASLALCDLLMGAVGIPLIIFCNLFDHDGGICTASAIFTQLISFTTVAHIFLLTGDRYIYILCALRYDDLVHRRRVLKVLAFAWVAITLVCTIRLTWVVGDREHSKLQDDLREKIYHIFSFASFFCLLFLVIVFMDVHMLCIVHRQTKRIFQRNLPFHLRKKSARQLIGRKRKAVLTCIIILTVYVLCWLPFFVLLLVNKPVSLAIWLQWLIYHMRFLSSACNPWLYTLRKYDLHREAGRWIRRTFPCIPRKRRQNEDTSIALRTTGTQERLNNLQETDRQEV